MKFEEMVSIKLTSRRWDIMVELILDNSLFLPETLKNDFIIIAFLAKGKILYEHTFPCLDVIPNGGCWSKLQLGNCNPRSSNEIRVIVSHNETTRKKFNVVFDYTVPILSEEEITFGKSSYVSESYPTISDFFRIFGHRKRV
jgi:hypothetical protein